MLKRNFKEQIFTRLFFSYLSLSNGFTDPVSCSDQSSVSDEGLLKINVHFCLLKDHESQIAAIESTFDAAQRPVSKLR